jgi:hypothetical protein
VRRQKKLPPTAVNQKDTGFELLSAIADSFRIVRMALLLFFLLPSVQKKAETGWPDQKPTGSRAPGHMGGRKQEANSWVGRGQPLQSVGAANLRRRPRAARSDGKRLRLGPGFYSD